MTPIRVLIVEDNPDNWDMLSRRLQRRGYQVEIATDGGQGVAKACEQLFDMILMDMSLPVIDGWEATRQIRAAGASAAAPIIALTAHAMAGDRERALEAGCDDYHMKPVELARLLEQMEALMAGGDSATNPVAKHEPGQTHQE